MFKRLAAPTGEIADSSSARPEDTPTKIVRSAVLVHSAPHGEEATLESSDGDITFDEDRIKLVVQSHNDMIAKLALDYGGFDKMPIGSFPPILDQHADDSNDRIRGRVAGLLRYEVRDVPKVGKNVACAVCDQMTFLGSDTVEQVIDGRIYHLSVGIDESTNTLGEVSTVIEPAAPGAMILSKNKKKNLKGAKKMTVKLAKLKALQGELKQLSKKASGAKAKVDLAKRKTEVSGRFVKLMADRKMSPAEFKKVDLVRLAKLDAESFESVMHVYEGREALLKSGQQGTTSAAAFSDVGTKEDTEVKRLKAAVKKSMKLSGTKFKKSDDEDEKDLEADDKADDKKKLAADADDEVSSVGEVGTPGADDQQEQSQQIDDLMKMAEENSAQIARVASMVDAIIDEMQDSGDAADDAEDKADESDAADLASGDDKKDDDDKKDSDDDKVKKDDKKSEGDK